MITTEEIATVVFKLLKDTPVKDGAGKVTTVKAAISGEIGYERTDYSKEDVIIVPHTITGEGSVRNGQINVNIHVPDLTKKKGVRNPVYITNIPRLMELRAMAIEVLKSHYQVGEGYDWTIGLINPPIKEPDQNEHFVSFALEITVRGDR